MLLVGNKRSCIHGTELSKVFVPELCCPASVTNGLVICDFAYRFEYAAICSDNRFLG